MEIASAVTARRDRKIGIQMGIERDVLKVIAQLAAG
jgi:hypothetical protein